MRSAVAMMALCAGLLGAAPAAAAGAPGDCGTVIVPTGVGVGSGADITSFNPLLVNSLYNAQAAQLLLLPLIWINRFQQIDYTRSLASAVSASADGSSYEVTLRPWHWSDGVPVTAADIAYTFGLIRTLGQTYVNYGEGDMPDIVRSFTVLDASHFRIVLKRPVNATWFIYNGLSQLLPLPQHVWGRYTIDQIVQHQSDSAFFGVVDGPMRIERMQFGLDLSLVPNPRYEGTPVHFSRLVFKFLETDGQALQGVEAGDLDMANLPDSLWGAVRHLKGIHIVAIPPDQSYNEIIPNLRNPAVAFFRDVRVRQAIADAVDQRQIVTSIDHGYGEQVWGAVPPVMTRFLTTAMQQGQYPVGYDPARARALLAEAGYTPGADGIMRKDGQRLSFTYLMLDGDALIQQIAEIWQADERAIGVEVTIREIEFNQMLALLNSGSPTSWEAAGLADTVIGYPTGESRYQTGGFNNSGGYSDPRMDALIQASTERQGVAALYAYETYAAAQQPVFFLEREGVKVLVRDGLDGVEDFVDPADELSPEQLHCRSTLH